MDSYDLLQQAIMAARNRDIARARGLFLDLVEFDPRNEVAWMWLSGLHESLDEQILACEKVLDINPDNTRTRLYLEELKKRANMPPLFHNRAKAFPETPSNPDVPVSKYTVDYALLLEEQGNIDKALEVYRLIAAKTSDRTEFDHIYNHMIRLEGLKAEKIKHVSPALSLLRLSVGWPILYTLLLLIQSGLRLIAWSTLYLWTGLIWVSIGSFCLALVDIRSHHVIWTKLFASRSAGGTTLARLLVGASGWLLISMSFLILLFDSINRLRNFEIPFPPQ